MFHYQFTTNSPLSLSVSTNPTTPYTFHCNNYQEFNDFIVLYYCTIHCILSNYCMFYSIVCIGLGIELYLAIQLFTCSAASMLQ